MTNPIIGNHYYILKPVSFCCESTVYKYIGIVNQIVDYHIMNHVATRKNYYLTSEQMEYATLVPPVLMELYDL